MATQALAVGRAFICDIGRAKTESRTKKENGGCGIDFSKSVNIEHRHPPFCSMCGKLFVVATVRNEITRLGSR